MLITVITGIISAVLITFSLLYLLFKKQKRFVSLKKLKFHCISGYLSLFAILVHIHFNFKFDLTSGYLSLIILFAVIISGIIRKHIAKNRIVYMVHLIFTTTLAVSIIYHILVNVLDLLII